MAIDKKTKALFRLMKLFLDKKEISSYDNDILSEFGCSSKTLERYLKDLESLYSHIITIKKSRKKVWKLIRVSEYSVKSLFKIVKILLKSLGMAQELDPENTQRDRKVVLFQGEIKG